ncbi:MAG: hypothetical protein QOF21_2738 [Actinomycetota bacterium]|jgi:hypothetical protein
MPALLRHARFFVAAAVAASGLAVLAPSVAASTTAASSSVQNGKIVFTRLQNSAGEPDIFTVNPDGSALTQLTTGTTRGMFASFLGDGTTIAYESVNPSEQTLNVSEMNADGSASHELFQIDQGMALDVAPDGSHFMWLGGNAQQEPVMIIANADGLDRHELASPDGVVSTAGASFSPDSTRIVFVRDSYDFNTTLRAIWTQDITGTNSQYVVSVPNAYLGSPSLSHDGERVIFGANTIGSSTRSFSVANIDGSDLHSIFSTTLGVDDPIFSPDGTQVAFSAYDNQPGGTQGPGAGIYVMNTDGTNVRQLTHGLDVAPSWQSLPAPPPPNVPPNALGKIYKPYPLWVLADGTPSTDADGTIVSYFWQWGDYTPFSSGAYAWHHYAAPGTYFVRLTVIDNQGATSIRGAWIKVT